MLNSYTRSSPQPNKNLNDSKITTSILPPQITSTPCIAPSKSRKISPLVTPRRFLGPRRYALSSNGTLSPLKTIRDPPGPLLTSTSYNVNVSTYIDSKSPGYTGRLIQYNEESSRHQQLTHQEKYGSPGLFPIVHLFKKDVPIITPKPKQATIRIGTPDLDGQYSQDHNRLLLEGIVRTNSVIKENSHSGNDVSTRSVLDALKEISRKRIHATEEYERDDSNKKLRRDCINGDGDCSKRNREVDSPTSDGCISPVAKQVMKKLCTIDAVLASKTSSMYANYDAGNKRKIDRKTMVSPLNKKKFNNAETQTMSASLLKAGSVSMESNKGSQDQKETVQKQTQSTIILEETKSPKQVLKIFDDKPLEIIRKNRLGALLSALTGHEIPPIPMEDRKKALDQDWVPKKPEKELVSILSSPDKPPKSSDKHVTFNISEASTKSANSTQFTENTLLPNNSTEILKVDSLEQKSSTEIQDTKKCSNPQMTCQSSNEEKSVDKVKDNAATSSMGGFKFGATTAVSTALGPSGGFKFDLSKPPIPAKDFIDKNSHIQSNIPAGVALITEPNKNLISSNVATSSPSSSTSLLPKFGITSEMSTSLQLPLNSSSDGKIFTKSVSPSTKTNSLGLPAALPLTTQSSFGKGTSVSSFTFDSGQSLASSKAFVKSKPDSFNNEGSSNHLNFLSSNISEPKIISTSTISTSVPKNDCTLTFSSQAIPDNLSAHSLSTLASTTNNILTTNSNTPLLTSTPSKFGIIASSTTNTAFGVPTSMPTFVSSSKSIVFATSSSIQGGLITSSVSSSTPKSATEVARSGGFSFTNSLPAFPIKSTFASGTATSVSSNNTLGNSPNFSDLQTNSAFSTTKTTPSYDTVPSSKLSYSSPGSTQPTFMFGSGKSFGHPSTSATSTNSTINSQSGMTLGTNTSASTASNIQVTTFGATGNTFSSAGNNPLVQSTSVASFGTTIPPAFATSITTAFGTNSSPAFGISTSSSSAKPVFGNTSMPAFGTAIAPTFGSTTAPVFGTTTEPTFGTTTAPTFGTTTAPPFGITTTSTFGTTTTPTFGSKTMPTFGTTGASNFGTTTSKPSFGTATETFGTTIAPTFGSTSATIFGTTTASNFGANNTPFATTTATSFGTSGTPFTTSAFGINTASSTFGSSNALNFAAPNMNSSTFGNTANFVAPSGTKPLFGTTNTLPFENTKTTTAGFSTSNNFVVPSTASNAFGTNTSSFGAPSSNPLFGTTNTSSFVASSKTPAFGTTTATFGASSPFGTTPTTSVSTFNSNNANLPFGNSSTNSFSTFGNANSAFSPVTTSAGFGSNNNFVNTASTTFGNNMTNNAFGNTNIASPFGTSANSTTFGNNVAATNGFGSAFGGTTSKPEQSNVFPSQANTMFGNSSTFGSLQSGNTANPGASSNGVFTFGSPNTQTSLSNGVFAFGAAESSKTFNFSAPGTSGNVSGPSASSFQAGNLNGPVPSMFNIGSGSSTTQSRSRPTSRAKRRT